MALGKVTREQQHFYLNTGEVFGIQNIVANFNLPVSPIKYIGYTSGSYVFNGPKITEFAISQFLITDDVFLDYTGDLAFNGHILRSKNNFHDNYSFKSGYLTNYSAKCQIGAAIEVAATISAYVDGGVFPTGEIPIDIKNSSSSFPLRIADPRSVSINIGDFNTNRVTSFDVNIACNRFPVYILGSDLPSSIRSQYPFDVSVKFQFEVDSYSGFRMSDYPCDRDVRNLSIALRDYESGLALKTYDFKNMTKISETYNNTVDGLVLMSVEYKGFINR